MHFQHISTSKKMPSPGLKRSVLSVLPLLLLLSITPLSSSFSPSDKVTKELLNELCSQPTIETNFCFFWLTTDPKTLTLDLNGLLDLVMRRSYYLGYSNLMMMKGLARTTTDSKLKNSYGSCITYYESAVKLNAEAIGFVSSKNYLLTSQSAAKAFVIIAVCEAVLTGRKNVPAYVPERNIVYNRMCNIGRVFSDVLRS
ncbi:PREDICTED: uncharacterized protein LOC104746064 [Camelina sativa]|uniref:Uncharacterized protein LOC104746064 n=1 Tax=Camelina sativa TaxID=90675 RepID=A0ABM0W4Z1_CAMSA|nr:PREDICTED: uncharacterized protein LOC104746064 [Camelina sativa]